ncbi:MAG TPA: DinB family protein [Chthonomonadaceae bacterium]|nr:DinB family protein [Chthonomonadaceae bacterium]
MAETLPTFLKRRAERSYRYLREQIEGLTAEEALTHYRADWPDHRWGIGQNGSIAGIVYHVATWKQLTLPVFAPGGRTLTREEFDVNAAPAPDDWAGITAWLEQIGDTWGRTLAALPDPAFDETRLWEGHSLPLSSFVVEMLEHDIQHAAQIEYLRQALVLAPVHMPDLRNRP